MEAVGAFSAILTIATECNRICKRLRRCLKNLKYARDDIKTIRDEVETFSTILHMFYRTITDSRLADEGLSAEIKASKVVQAIVRSGNAALEKIEDILDDVRPLRSDKTSSTLERCIARWKWSTRKDEWAPIQISLISVKQNAELLMSMVYFQDLFRKFEELQAEALMVPKDILDQLSLCASEIRRMISRCKRTAAESRVRDQQAQVSKISREIAAVASRLIRSHIASHPGLEAVLNDKGAPFSATGNSTASTNSSSPGSPQIRPYNPDSPRGPPPSGPSSGPAPGSAISSDSSGQAPLPGVPSDDAAHIPIPGTPTMDQELKNQYPRSMHMYLRRNHQKLTPPGHNYLLRIRPVTAKSGFQQHYLADRNQAFVHPIPDSEMQIWQSTW
ncbi:hypothetical protein PV04_06784 [Phialophora macrospora]|uniref:Fungal N-terminal domain-containing protein n=1 Tax=Phialophora macrospora TaxID=1851006 RepID=A0A0D2FLF3_9EURO|nr:hypothetical protein PV04_06784 [Phialophora macrospora]